jgi:hypothetical protein
MHLLAFVVLSQQPTRADPIPEGQRVELRTTWPLSSTYHADIVKLVDKSDYSGTNDLSPRSVTVFSVTARQVSADPFIYIPYNRYLVRERRLRNGHSDREVFYTFCAGGASDEDVIKRLDFCAEKRTQLDGPRRWREMQDLLRSRAELKETDAINVGTLLPTSPIVTKFLADALAPTHELFGLKLASGLFYCSIGIVIGILTLTLLPFLFKATQYFYGKENDSTELILFRLRGLPGILAEGLILSLTTAWMLIPLLILYLQQRGLRLIDASIELTTSELVMLRLGTGLLIASFVISVAIVVKLHQVRRRDVPS